MEALIDDLLTLARSGGAIDDREPVGLAALTDRCWADLETADATLVVEADRRIPADRSRLRQLLENLLRNAVEHSSTGNRTQSDDAAEHSSTGNQSRTDDAVEHGENAVTVTVGDLRDGFYVGDDGPGIPEAERDDVFEAGYSTADAGTGFGLRIVQQVAEAHDWTIRLTESADGGARFESRGVDSEG